MLFFLQPFLFDLLASHSSGTPVVRFALFSIFFLFFFYFSFFMVWLVLLCYLASALAFNLLHLDEFATVSFTLFHSL